MLRSLYHWVTRIPALVIAVVLALTAFFASQLHKLEWETDARVYMPKGHPAIVYDEKVEHVFGAKDAVIIGIVNEEKGVFNRETLARIARITEKVAALEGVIANRTIDVASLSTANAFVGDEESIGTHRLMERVPETPEAIEQLKRDVFGNADLFVGNIVSEDGTAAMIRAKLKEGAANRYMTYWQIKGILQAEEGDSEWGKQWWGKWQNDTASRDQTAWQSKSDQTRTVQSEHPDPDVQPAASSGREEKSAAAPFGPEGIEAWVSTEPSADSSADGSSAWNAGSWKGGDASQPAVGSGEEFITAQKNGDQFILAGRPVIEVTSGLEAMEDLKRMIPLLLGVVVLLLMLIFRTARGIILPLFVMGAAIIWTMGSMALLGVPLYTISTMLPVILVAVGIGDGIHLMSRYYDTVLPDPHRPSRDIVLDVMDELGPPLITTSLTTAVGFLSLWFAEMPPFKVFGLFTVLGILYCWLLSVTFIPAILTVLKPKVGGYLEKRRSMRMRNEQSRLVQSLVHWANWTVEKRSLAAILVVLGTIASLGAASTLYVDSSWLSDFREDSEVATATRIINDKFDGSIQLHVVVDAKSPGALKSPDVLAALETLQTRVEGMEYVGDSLSVTDYLKSMNKNLHAGQDEFNVLPDTQAQIAEYLFLFSISGRPEELDEVVDFDYRLANATFMIKTDRTKALKTVVDEVKAQADQVFEGMNVEVNLAGSANNSYVWADLLINSQITAIVLSKIGIFLLASLLFRSFLIGLFVVIPVTVTTILMAGVSGAAGIPMDVSTALAAGVAIGVGVDYAVHYIFKYMRERRRSDHAAATRETMRSVGKTIVLNATVVTAGFAVLLFSLFPPHVKLGAFVSGYMVLSCLAALIALPVLFSISKNPVPEPSDGVS